MNQTKATRHYVFVHGEQYRPAADIILAEFPAFISEGRIVPVYLPFNTADLDGAMQVYGAAPWLVREQVVFFLDDDNIYEPNHVESMLALMDQHGLDWAFSLRKIIDQDGRFLIEDDCESLGHWPCASAHSRGVVNDWHAYCCDNSCFAVKREAAIRNSPGWFMRFCSDRFFMAHLKANAGSYGCTGMSTMLYRKWNGQNHSPISMFENGNAYYRGVYPGGFPWRNPTVFRKEKPAL